MVLSGYIFLYIGTNFIFFFFFFGKFDNFWVCQNNQIDN